MWNCLLEYYFVIRELYKPYAQNFADHSPHEPLGSRNISPEREKRCKFQSKRQSHDDTDKRKSKAMSKSANTPGKLCPPETFDADSGYGQISSSGNSSICLAAQDVSTDLRNECFRHIIKQASVSNEMVYETEEADPPREGQDVRRGADKEPKTPDRSRRHTKWLKFRLLLFRMWERRPAPIYGFGWRIGAMWWSQFQMGREFQIHFKLCVSNLCIKHIIDEYYARGKRLHITLFRIRYFLQFICIFTPNHIVEVASPRSYLSSIFVMIFVMIWVCDA